LTNLWIFVMMTLFVRIILEHKSAATSQIYFLNWDRNSYRCHHHQLHNMASFCFCDVSTLYSSSCKVAVCYNWM